MAQSVPWEVYSWSVCQEGFHLHLNQRFITMFSAVWHWIQYWTRYLNSEPYILFCKIHFNIILHSVAMTLNFPSSCFVYPCPLDISAFQPSLCIEYSDNNLWWVIILMLLIVLCWYFCIVYIWYLNQEKVSLNVWEIGNISAGLVRFVLHCWVCADG